MKSSVKFILGALPAIGGIILFICFDSDFWVVPLGALLIGISYGLAWVHNPS